MSEQPTEVLEPVEIDARNLSVGDVLVLADGDLTASSVTAMGPGDSVRVRVAEDSTLIFTLLGADRVRVRRTGSRTTPTPPVDPMTVSLAVQMSPMWRPGRVGEAAFAGDLPRFAEDLTRYFVTQLERFTEQRGAALFVALSVQRSGQTAAHEYRSGYYVKPAEEATP